MRSPTLTGAEFDLTGLVDDKLKSRLDRAAIERDLELFIQARIEINPETFNVSQAKDNWSAITRDAEQGRATVIERNGMKLILISADKLFDVAEQSRRERTFADIFDAYPGVAGPACLEALAPGGPVVQELQLPKGEPAV